MKVSIVIPVYYNGDNLHPLYEELKRSFVDKVEYEYELVFVDDGSKDNSYGILKELKEKDSHIKIYRLSKNFGSHSAILCGLSMCTGDCAVVKAADMQEPTRLIFDMLSEWKKGNNVVLAVRDGREDGAASSFFSNLYYKMIQKTSFPQMPDEGFDVYLVDRKVIEVLKLLDEKNSALTCQILWSGFKTSEVRYHRLERKIGKSRWTLKKKIKLLMDTLFSFSNIPITLITDMGLLSVVISLVWGVVVFIMKLKGKILVSGWTSLLIFNLFSFGMVMITLGVIGGYLWRTYDACRNRPPYIIEDKEE